MNHWHQYPFIRLTIPLMAGIIIGFHVNVSPGLLLILTGVSTSTLALILLLRKKLHAYRSRWLFGIAISLFLIFSGMGLTLLKKYKYSIQLNDFPVENIKQFSGIVLNPPEEKENSICIKLNIKAFRDSTWHKAKIKAILYFEKDSMINTLKYGDEIFLKSRLQAISPPKNPGEFDYREYLANKGIFYQSYIKKNKWRLLPGDKGNILLKWSYQLRDYFLHVLKKNGLRNNEYDIAAAILLGYDAELDRQMKQQFSGAGAMHILCVSGLHVGIIYLFFSVILGFLKKLKFGSVIKAVALILIIWFYALLTGMSPSVMRAATMFTFVSIGQTFKRYTNIYNTLAASAFFLLVINPFMLMEVGFQLSYSAVFAIIWIQPFLSKMLLFDNKILKYFFDIFTVSIAAQLGTFPLAIYYFHQFPNYFILTNLLVIPLSFIIIFSGLSVALFAFWGWASFILTKLLNLLLLILNSSVGFIHHLPGAVSQNLKIDIFQLFLVYLIIILIIHLLKNKRYYILKYALSCTALLSITFTIQRINHKKQNEFIVYNIPNHTAIEFYIGKQSIFLADSSLMTDKKKNGFHIQGNRINKGIKKLRYININVPNHKSSGFIKKGNIFSFNGITFLLANQHLVDLYITDSITVDYLIVDGYERYSYWKNKLKKIRADKVIISSSLNYWQVEKIRKELKEITDSVHIISEHGFYKQGFYLYQVGER